VKTLFAVLVGLCILAGSAVAEPKVVTVVKDKVNLAFELSKVYESDSPDLDSWQLKQASKRLVDKAAFALTVPVTKHFSFRGEFGLANVATREEFASVSARIRFYN
jgi:hypothetical protein